MNLLGLLIYILMVSYMLKELSYFKEKIIFAKKTFSQLIIYIVGILILIILTIIYAKGLFQISFGIIIIIAISASYFKQGITSTKVLTNNKTLKEVYFLKEIDYIKINGQEVYYYNNHQILLFKQKFSETNIIKISKLNIKII